jgi:pimeloyl-ACP methyl ester carboxylesterase
MRRRVVVLLVVLVAAAAGCGGSSEPAASPRATATPTSPAPVSAATPSPTRVCGEPAAGARVIHFRTRDGVSLAGAVLGGGPTGAVLIHEYPLDYCGWLPYARYLARRGVRVLLFDLRCFGQSACPHGRGHAIDDVAAATAELRRRGARSVALVGASMGGSIAVVAGARLHPAAVVDLSGERDTTALTQGINANAGAAAPDVTAPALFVVARRDQYTSVADMRAVARRARSTTKRLIVLPASAGHGWGMLLGLRADWSPLAATVAAFIRRHTEAPTTR